MDKKRFIIRLICNLLFFILLIYVTFRIIFKDQNIDDLYNIIFSVDLKFVILAFVFMCGHVFMESYNLKRLLTVLDDKRISIFKSIKYTLIGFFFSGVTPAASGGQPVEIYYMTKEKISGAKATLSLLIQLCAFQISALSVGLICALTNMHYLSDGMVYFYIIGFLLNFLVLAIMMICVFNKRLTLWLSNLLFKLFDIFKVKNKDKKKKNINDAIERYNQSSLFIKNNKKEFINTIIRTTIQVVFYYSIPYAIYRSFGLTDCSYFSMFAMQAILFTSVSSIPLPGSVGISESIFLRLFGSVYGEVILSSAMLLTRGISFYLFIIISLIVVIVNSIMVNKAQK